MIALQMITSLYLLAATFQGYHSPTLVFIITVGGSTVSAFLNFNLVLSLWETSMHFLIEMQLFTKIFQLLFGVV